MKKWWNKWSHSLGIENYNNSDWYVFCVDHAAVPRPAHWCKHIRGGGGGHSLYRYVLLNRVWSSESWVLQFHYLASWTRYVFFVSFFTGSEKWVIFAPAAQRFPNGVLQSCCPDPKFHAIPLIPRVSFGIPPPAHNFNPESRSCFALKSWIPSFKQGKSCIPCTAPHPTPSPDPSWVRFSMHRSLKVLRTRMIKHEIVSPPNNLRYQKVASID